MCLDIYP